jgi:hypothetical protein
MPSDVQIKLYSDFLFSDFLDTYKRFFSIPKKEADIKHAYYTWNDYSYRQFMIEILQKLEPRKEEKNTILLNELDEINEVIFFDNGTFEIGYEINKFTKYVIKFRNYKVLEAYGATFNKRSQFIYRTVTECKGYFIRKSNWLSTLTDNPNLAEELKKKIIIDYEYTVKSKINKSKEKDIQRWEGRNDYEGILVMTNLSQKNQTQFHKTPQNPACTYVEDMKKSLVEEFKSAEDAIFDVMSNPQNHDEYHIQKL